jgi:GNAT superfamily N-acetyltransferase
MPAIEDLSPDNLDELCDWPGGCQVGACVYWEHYEHSKSPVDERAALKTDWFRRVTAEFGCCGKLARAEAVPVGFVQFAPACYLPCALTYGCGPPSEEAVLVSCLLVAEGWRGTGVGRALLQAVVENLRQRDLLALETYGRKGSRGDNNPGGPLRFWLKHDFRVVREDPEFALVRKELMPI